MQHSELHRCLLIGQHHANKIIVRQTSRLSLMPGQPKILEYLYSHNCCTQKEIGEGCFLDKSTVTSLYPAWRAQDSFISPLILRTDGSP